MLTPPKMKQLCINPTKYIQDLYEENYKTLMNKIKEEPNKWRDIPCSWTVRLNIVKTSVFPNVIYRFNAIPIQIPTRYFVDTGRHSKVYTDRQKTKNSQHNVGEQSWKTDTIRLSL